MSHFESFYMIHREKRSHSTVCIYRENQVWICMRSFFTNCAFIGLGFGLVKSIFCWNFKILLFSKLSSFYDNNGSYKEGSELIFLSYYFACCLEDSQCVMKRCYINSERSHWLWQNSTVLSGYWFAVIGTLLSIASVTWHSASQGFWLFFSLQSYHWFSVMLMEYYSDAVGHTFRQCLNALLFSSLINFIMLLFLL